jgi:hypothetical protein
MVVVALALLMRVPPLPPAESPVEAAEAFPGAWVRVVSDDGSDTPCVFHMQSTGGGGVYESHIEVDGRTFSLRGSVSASEFRALLGRLESYRASAGSQTDERAPTRRLPRYTVYVMPWSGAPLREGRFTEAWSPQYQAFRGFLDRSIVGRTEDALHHATGL